MQLQITKFRFSIQKWNAAIIKILKYENDFGTEVWQQKICKDFQDCANEILKCLEHEYLKKTEENLMENWSLAILIPAVMYKFENVPKDLG